MTDYFLQIVLALIGALVEILARLLRDDQLEKVGRVVAILLITTAGVWAIVERMDSQDKENTNIQADLNVASTTSPQLAPTQFVSESGERPESELDSTSTVEPFQPKATQLPTISHLTLTPVVRPSFTATSSILDSTPLPTATNEAVTFKVVGESYEANGISLALVDFTISSDGKIGLKFTVTNQANGVVLVRFKDQHFSVNDDTGKAYPQDEDFLLDVKQVELSPGGSFEISGDGWPNSYKEIGYFYGIVSEQANNLLVKVSQFMDLQDMQWAIPLNAQLSGSQTPVQGTQQAVLDGFSANGITLLLSDYTIKSDGTIWLEFLVGNEGSNSVLLRYQDKYFEVYDDLGNKYDQDQDFLLEPKQVLISPGGSYEITGDGWPDSYKEIGCFYGKVSEQSNYLIVKVSQFADLQDMQWAIPLNAQLSSSQTPVQGTQQAVLDGFSANGITLLLSDYTIKSDGTIWLEFLVRNEGSSSVLLRYQDKYFGVYDDLGNKYDQDEDFLLEPKQVLISPGGSFEMSGDGWPDSYKEIGYFYGKVSEQADYLIVKVSQFAVLQDMQWAIPLNAQLSSSQTPVQGTQQAVLDGFSANGITLLLSDYTIKSDGTIWLEFLVRNEGSSSVLLRYQDKYFEVYDDLGNKYDQDEDFLLEPKQALISPGGSFEMSGDSWPDSYKEIGYFYGKVSEQSNYLIVKVSQFADLQDMQWAIPLN